MIETKKKSKKLFLLLPLILFLVIYNAIPEKITIFEGQKFNTLLGISAKAENYAAGNYKCNVLLFDIFPIKTVSVSVEPQICVIPSGEAIGVKLHTDGVLVIGSGSVTDTDGNSSEPAKKAGIVRGDRIVAVNDEPVSTNNDLRRIINREKGQITVSIMRGEEALNLPVTAVYSNDTDSYLIGLWVRDSAAGIGTLTFYNPGNHTFAALGHGICDYDTDALFCVRDGSINYCRIKDVVKSENGSPGELLGEFSAKKAGDILINSQVGIYGNITSMPTAPLIPVASRFEAQTGEAQILCDVDGEGPKAYKIEITKVSKIAKLSGKSFVFKVCDDALTAKTGGIVQGMSGSPVLQNGKLLGAVTHVFVNDSTRGYGIFAENMLDMTNMME